MFWHWHLGCIVYEYENTTRNDYNCLAGFQLNRYLVWAWYYVGRACDLRGLIVRYLIAFLLIACGSVDNNADVVHNSQEHSGIVVVNTVGPQLEKGANRFVGLLGIEFGVDFAAVVAGLDIVIMAHLNAVECTVGSFVAGCTHKRYETRYDIDLVYHVGENIKESALAHELGHVYACAMGECDSEHKQRDIWIAVGNAERKYQ